MCGFITWLGIAISHYRFRRAFVAQGRDLNELPFRARWFPFGPLFAFVLCAIVIVGQSLSYITTDGIDWKSIFATYISVPLFLILWLGYKWSKRTRLVPLQECDLDTGARHDV